MVNSHKIGGLLAAVILIFSSAAHAQFVENPDNGHFYKFKDLGVFSTLQQALNDVANEVGPNGEECYVATVTSLDEANFVFDSVIEPISPLAFLLGASDGAVETVWKWINGPEDGLVFWNNGPVAGVNAASPIPPSLR